MKHKYYTAHQAAELSGVEYQAPRISLAVENRFI
jgi:hypothetical protein